MDFESEVTRSISLARKTAAARRFTAFTIGLMFLFATCVPLAGAFAIIFGVTSMNGHMGIVVILITLFVFVQGALWYTLHRMGKQYASLMPGGQEAALSQGRSYAHFADALQSVCGGFGMFPVPLQIVRISTPNALALKVGGSAVVGISPELLEADLSASETEAVMAHEAARIVIGDVFSRPLLYDTKWFAAASAVFILVAVGVAALRMPHVILIVELSLVVLFLIVLAGGMSYRKRTAARLAPNRALELSDPSSLELSSLNEFICINALLADSLAVKVTGQPRAMQEAIRRLGALV